MVITFQVQIDPLTFYGNTWEPNTNRTFSSKEQAQMKELMESFVSDLDRFNEYLRAEMYVDGKVYHG